MPQFFVQSSDITDGRCAIRGDDYRHLAAVRRVKAGDIIHLRDERGSSLTARVESIGPDHLEAAIIGENRTRDIPVDITLCVCLIKGGNFDLAIEKAVEVGVSRIIPVVSERTVPRPSDAEAKVRRWNRKAEEAAKQSLRERVPVVERVRAFSDVIGLNSGQLRIMAHPGAPVSLKQCLRAGAGSAAVSILVGPEGGFSPGELEAAAAAGWTVAGFGFSQLRAETAAAVLCGIIVYEWGDLTP